VDDNATNRRILQDMLLHWKMDPRCVASGAEALRAMQEATSSGAPYALVLLDAMMPEMDGFSVAETLRGNRAFDGTTIMMISSADQNEDLARCRTAGIQSYLTKPVTSSVLFDAIASALEESRREIQTIRLAGKSEAIGFRCADERDSVNRAAMPELKSLQLLLAEDNVVNQKVTVGILEAARHRVTVVNNGKEAVAALEKHAYDAVLMDVQMPEMDGFQATAAIREREKSTGRHTPIIALTAHAMKGDLERCRVADMDDYVPKPIQPEELFRAIRKCVGHVAERGKLGRQEINAEAAALDRGALLARVGGDAKILVEILQLCPEQFTRLMDELERAVFLKHAQRIQSTAHTLKGTLGSLSATHAYEAALVLEKVAQKGQSDRALEAFRLLQEQVEHVKLAVANLKTELTSSGGPCHVHRN
jgi:CheY-like chemotaxis protein/HPt (histidine-containing phosphotransfer) domain-containing protein